MRRSFSGASGGPMFDFIEWQELVYSPSNLFSSSRLLKVDVNADSRVVMLNSKVTA